MAIAHGIVSLVCAYAAFSVFNASPIGIVLLLSGAFEIGWYLAKDIYE